MDKKQMAHAYALQMLATIQNCDRFVGGPDVKNIARNAWDLAEAMEQEYKDRFDERGAVMGDAP